MKINSIIIGCIIGAVTCFLVMMYMNRGEFTDQSFYDNLQRQNDSLRKENIKLDQKLQVLDIMSGILESKIDSQKTRVVYIKQKQSEKNVIISGYNGSQLFNFFSAITIPKSTGPR